MCIAEVLIIGLGLETSASSGAFTEMKEYQLRSWVKGVICKGFLSKRGAICLHEMAVFQNKGIELWMQQLPTCSPSQFIFHLHYVTM